MFKLPSIHFSADSVQPCSLNMNSLLTFLHRSYLLPFSEEFEATSDKVEPLRSKLSGKAVGSIKLLDFLSGAPTSIQAHSLRQDL